MDRQVDLFLLIEDDRGLGSTVQSAHASEIDAEAARGSHEYVYSVKVSEIVLRQLLAQLKINN